MRKELSPLHEAVACEVCGRTILKGERTEAYLVPDGSRRLVCELCTRRAESAGWLRESAHPDAPAAFPRPEPRRSLLGRFWRRRSESEETEEAGTSMNAQDERIWGGHAIEEADGAPYASSDEELELEEGLAQPADQPEPELAPELVEEHEAEEDLEFDEDFEAEEDLEAEEDFRAEDFEREEGFEAEGDPDAEEDLETDEDLAVAAELETPEGGTDPEAGWSEESGPPDSRAERRAPSQPPSPRRVGQLAEERRLRRERRARRRDPRHVRAIPTNAEARIERGLEIFNASDYRRTVAGLVRTLGSPWVTAVAVDDSNSEVTVVVAWELSWYQYRVELGDTDAPVTLARKGQEIEELDEELRRWNAAADRDGALAPGTPAR